MARYPRTVAVEMVSRECDGDAEVVVAEAVAVEAAKVILTASQPTFLATHPWKRVTGFSSSIPTVTAFCVASRTTMLVNAAIHLFPAR